MRPSARSTIDPQVSANHGIRLPAWTRWLGARRAPTASAEPELANLLVRRGSTIVAVGSRKGGVGKTSHAAGVAIVAGAALDAVGRCAAIVDANIANPDAWGQLNLPPGAATVRDMVVALTSDVEPPRPVHASTPALACFPEARETSEYSRTEIGLFVAWLRLRYPLVVVDMSNRLPDPTAGPEASRLRTGLNTPTCWFSRPPRRNRTSTASSTTSTCVTCRRRSSRRWSRERVAIASTRLPSAT